MIAQISLKALLSSDDVYFYVNFVQLVSSSSNAFNGLLHVAGLHGQSTPSVGAVPVVPVDEPSDVLNILIHAIFDMSCAADSPSIESMMTAIVRMQTYGLCRAHYLAPSTPLFSLLLAQAPLHGISIYALAAENQIEEIAVPVSSYLLSFPLSSITDDLANKMGPVYLRRLFFMHFGRVEALKRLLKSPPSPHLPSAYCDFSSQQKVTRIWALAASSIVWDSRPGE